MATAAPSTETDFPITRVLLWATAVEAVVLLTSGGGLFFAPTLTASLWPWPDLPPFNTAFLGAIYLASLVAVLFALRTRRWAPARVMVPMIGVFTLTVLVVSLVHASRFAFAERPVQVVLWFVLYTALPLSAFAHLWLWRGRPGADQVPVPGPWRRWLQASAAVLTGYGIAMLVAPEAVTAFWPWSIDAFHGRMYAATFLAGGVGMWLVARQAARIELLAVAVTQVAFWALAIIGVLLANASTGRVVWSAPGTVVWLVLAGVGLLSGVALARRAVRGS